MRRMPKPQLITNAPRTPEQELRGRERRYVFMMLLRAVCIIVASVLVMVRAPWLPLWLTLCVAGAVVLPWMAVLLANDKGPRPEHLLRNKFHRREPAAPEPTLALTETERVQHKVIDLEP